MDLTRICNLTLSIVEQLEKRYVSKIEEDVCVFARSYLTGSEDTFKMDQSWQALKDKIITEPKYLSIMLPRELGINDDLVSAAGYFNLKSFQHPEANLLDDYKQWLNEELSHYSGDDCFTKLVSYLVEHSINKYDDYEYLSKYYLLVDLIYSHLICPSLSALHDDIYELAYQQKINWSKVYCNGYFYQGLDAAGIRGVKPSRERISKYDILGYLNSSQTVLDIGGNAGFLAAYIASSVKQIDSVEYNPYMHLVNQKVNDHLGLENVTPLLVSFENFFVTEKYDVVFSLSNHATIDNKLQMNFDDYIFKIFTMLNENGIFFFESHNIFGAGKGGPGDDGDIEKKINMMLKYFAIESYKMVSKLVPAHDIDKLFIVMKRKNEIDLNEYNMKVEIGRPK